MVYFFGTCNNIDAMPPEFIRRGRWDELWFHDLPTGYERPDIFAIHLIKRGRNPENFDIKKLSRISEGFSGAEIENSINASMRRAFVEGREFTTKDIEKAVSETVSLSLTKSDDITRLRRWAKDNARLSSYSEKENAKESGGLPFWQTASSGTKKKQRSKK